MGCRIKKSLKGQIEKTFGTVKASNVLYLINGKHEISMILNTKIENVWISSTTEDIPVCCGNLNKFSTTIAENGFVINAEINTDRAMLKWVATAEED